MSYLLTLGLPQRGLPCTHTAVTPLPNFCLCLLVAGCHVVCHASVAARGRRLHSTLFWCCHCGRTAASWMAAPAQYTKWHPAISGGTGTMCHMASCCEWWHGCDRPLGILPRVATEEVGQQHDRWPGCSSLEVSGCRVRGTAPPLHPTVAWFLCVCLIPPRATKWWGFN